MGIMVYSLLWVMQDFFLSSTVLARIMGLRVPSKKTLGFESRKEGPALREFTLRDL